jgi:hypothetical protein
MQVRGVLHMDERVTYELGFGRDCHNDTRFAHKYSFTIIMPAVGSSSCTDLNNKKT